MSNYADPFESQRTITKNCAGTTGKIRACGHTSRENPGERVKTSLGTGELKSTRGEWVEKAVATHSSTLAWKIPWAEEPGRLQSMGS